MTMRVQSRSRAGRVKHSARAARGEDRRGGATIPAAHGREDLAKKARAARVEAAKKAPKPRRPGGKVVQMDLFRAGAERDKKPPKKASKEKPARKGAAEPPAAVADAPKIAESAEVTAAPPAAEKSGAAGERRAAPEAGGGRRARTGGDARERSRRQRARSGA